LKDIVHEIDRRAVPLLASVTFLTTVSASAHGTTSAISGAENRAALIANAESAGPDAIAKHATILAWPTTPGGELVVLREGNNGWTCMPRRPDTKPTIRCAWMTC